MQIEPDFRKKKKSLSLFHLIEKVKTVLVNFLQIDI